MKENKDRNRVVFGPSYKDLEEQARTERRERKFEEFEVDLRLDLGEVPEITTPTFPTFSGPGVLPPDPGIIQTAPAGVVTRDAYVDFDGVLGYGPNVILDYNTTNAMFDTNTNSSSLWWPTLSCPGGSSGCNISNNAYGILQVRSFSGALIDTLSGFNSRSFAVVNGVIYAVSYNAMRYWDGTSWVNIPIPQTGTDSANTWYGVFTYDESNGRHYVMSYQANTASSLNARIRVGAILPDGSVFWGNGVSVARNLRGPSSTQIRSSPATTSFFNGRAKYGRAYFTFGTAPRWREYGQIFDESTLDNVLVHLFVSVHDSALFTDFNMNMDRAYTMADTDIYGRFVVPSRYNQNSTTTRFHGPNENNSFTIHDMSTLARQTRIWLPPSLPSQINLTRPAQIFTPFDDRIFILGRSTGNVATVWETKLGPTLPNSPTIQDNTKVLWEDTADSSQYTFGFTPAPEWPFYTFGTEGGIRFGLFPPYQ